MYRNIANNTPLTLPFSAFIVTTSCVRTDGLNLGAQEIDDIGWNAIQFKLLDEAKRCYFIGAKMGDAVAQRQLSRLLMKDAKTEQEYADAFNWLKKSAELGDYFAQIHVSRLYEAGFGTPQDSQQAKYWASIAASNPLAPQEVSTKTDILRDAWQDPTLRELTVSLFASFFSGDARGRTPDEDSRQRQCFAQNRSTGAVCY